MLEIECGNSIQCALARAVDEESAALGVAGALVLENHKVVDFAVGAAPGFLGAKALHPLHQDADFALEAAMEVGIPGSVPVGDTVLCDNDDTDLTTDPV